MSDVLERTFPLPPSVDLRMTLAPLRRSAGDPTMRIGPEGVWRATRTPCGPATVHLRQAGSTVHVRAWGDGAEWAVETAPALVGAMDDPVAAGFDASAHPLVAELWRRYGAGVRFCRSGVVTEALVPTILEQKVVAADAKQAYRRLVRSYGEPAPGPAAAGLLLPPAPARLARVPGWAFHRFNVEGRRAEAVRLACRVAHRLEESVGMGALVARKRMTALPGIGTWSASEVLRLALGDADAVSFGDYHLKHLVSYSLAGEPVGTDERMAELLEPWRASGQRARVVRLLELGGSMPPRRGPRMPRQSIAAI